ncbi:MAG: hypothetical protein LC799_32530 [Actinobacteria bacterium]|nr:hypothetical protein [Actinomycetota bacterium]
MSESDELLGFVLEALDEIDVLVGYGHDEFATSLDRQRALAFCWIAVGSALKDYARIFSYRPGKSLCHLRSGFVIGAHTNHSASLMPIFSGASVSSVWVSCVLFSSGCGLRVSNPNDRGSGDNGSWP